eukprot:6548279-Alexandrium_andersonii.AAC.1
MLARKHADGCVLNQSKPRLDVLRCSTEGSLRSPTNLERWAAVLSLGASAETCNGQNANGPLARPPPGT